MANKKVMTEEELVLTVQELDHLRKDFDEIMKIPEKWGAIMLPLSAGILTLAVNSIKELPSPAIVFLVLIASLTTLIWRLMGYSAMSRARIYAKTIREIEDRLSFDVLTIKRTVRVYAFGGLSQSSLLDIFAFAYIFLGIVLIFAKFFWL